MTGPDQALEGASDRAFDRAAWSWSEHLRHGGSREWRGWEPPETGAVAPPPGWSPSGAAQLELVRRLAAHATLTGPAFTALADLVLDRSGPGRGLAQQPLSWSPHGSTRGATRVGAPPVDPVDVPVEELVRLAVGTLAELLLSGSGAPSPRTTLRRLPFTRTPAFRLVGAPVSTAACRRVLGAAGHAEGGGSPVVVLVVEPLDVALAQVWSARVQAGAAARWPGLLDRWSSDDALPRAVDLAALGRAWAARVGADRVHVVVADGAADRTAELAAEAIGMDLRPRTRPGFKGRMDLVSALRDLPAASVEAARRVNALLGVRAEGERRAEAVRALVAVLPGGPRIRPLTVPERHRAWVLARAERMAEKLLDGGYPVCGRVADLVPDMEGRPSRPRTPAVLEALLTACLRQADQRADKDQGHRTEAT